MAVRRRARDALRRWELAGTDRAGRYARAKVWDRSMRVVRRAWWFLAAGLLIIPGLAVPLALMLPGWAGWLVMGAALATALWLDVLAVLIFGGAIPALSGLLAETATAEELRRLRRRGWRLVNGLVLRGNADIDHVAVGPAGVLVVETKYSDEAWLGSQGSPFMDSRLDQAREQVLRNRRHVARHEDFKRAIAGAPVRAVLVLHSSAPDEGSPGWIEEPDGLLTVLGDRSLAEWLSTLDQHQLDADGVERVWGELSKHVARRDQWAESRSHPPRPTLYRVLFGWIMEAPLGFYGAVYASVTPLSKAFGGRAFAFVVPLVIAIGARLHAVRRLRRFAIGWLAGCLAVTTFLALTLIRAVVR
jgi:hypothetical protein